MSVSLIRDWQNRITTALWGLCAGQARLGCGGCATHQNEARDGRNQNSTHVGVQYHAFIETTADGADRAAIRELIAAGMRLHNIVGCSAHEDTVTKLGDDGVAFVGSCVLNLAHATPAGGI
jgi:hypothetical protein